MSPERTVVPVAEQAFSVGDQAPPHGVPAAALSIKGFIIFITHFLLAALLLAGGVFLIQLRAQAEPAAALDTPVNVHVVNIQQQTGYTFKERFAGHIEAAQTIQLAFESGGTIRQILVSEGDRVRKGDIMAVLDTRSVEAEQRQRQASRRQLVAVVEGAELELQRERELESRALTTDRALDNARLLVEQSTAAVEEMDAMILSLDINVEKASIRAPFAGVVGTRYLDEGAFAGPGTPVVTLFETASPEVVFSLPVDRVDQLVAGQHYPVLLDERHFKATFLSVRSDLNPQTRTVDARFVIEVPEDSSPPIFGQLVRIDLVRSAPVIGYWIPVTALTEGRRSLWSVLAVLDAPGPGESPSPASGVASDNNTTSGLSKEDSENQGKLVHRVHVEVVHSNASQVFVNADLPASANIIDDGVHRVVPGQRVVITPSDR